MRVNLIVVLHQPDRILVNEVLATHFCEAIRVNLILRCFDIHSNIFNASFMSYNKVVIICGQTTQGVSP